MSFEDENCYGEITQDNHTYQFDVYLAPSFGLGVFTREFIKKGSVVWKPNPDWFTIVSEEQFNESPLLQKYAYQESVTGEIILLRDISRFENHSDTPNVKDSIAIRDIHPGEEITGDYRQYDLKHKSKLW